MKKKILSVSLILALVFSFSVVFATENTEIPDLPAGVLPDNMVPTDLLTANDNVEDIINQALVDSNANSETIDGNKIIGEESVNFNNTTVNGNLIVFGQKVNLENIEVNGDVAIFGQDIEISNLSIANGTIVIAGQDIEINTISTVGNVYIAGEDIEAEMFARDLYTACAKLSLKGRTEISKVYNYSGDFSIESGTYDVVETGIENLSIGANVVVNGDLKYSSENEGNIDPSAKVGNVDFTQKEKQEVEVKKITPKDILKSKVNSVLTIVVKTAIVCGFIFLCAEGFIKKTKVEDPVKYIGVSALKGLGLAIVVPIVSVMLLFTGFGASTAIVIMGIYLIIFWAVVPFVSIAIMNIILKDKPTDKKKAYGITILIALCLGILGQIPVIGGLVKTLVAFAGFGIFMGTLKFDKKSKAKVEKAEEVKEVEKVEEPKAEEDNSEKNK